MKKFLPTLTSILLSLTFLTNVYAETVDIQVAENPNVDILLTTGNFDVDLSNFENDIKNELKKDGINTNNVSFQTIETKTEQVDESKVADIFASWNSYGVSFTRGTSPVLGTVANKTASSVWQLSGDKLQNTSGSGSTIDVFMSNDFHKTSKEKSTVRFGLATNNSSTHGEAWYFFRVDKNLKNGYALVWDNHSACGPFSNADYRLYLVRVSNGTVTILNTLNVATWTNGAGRYWDVDIDIVNDIATIKITGTNSATWTNINVGLESINSALKDTEYTTSFGVYSYVGAYFSNITNTQITTRDFSDVLTEPTWRNDATHVLVNVDSDNNASLIQNPETLTRTLTDDIHFIQFGSSVNEQTARQFISLNDNKGLFTLGTTSANYPTAIKNASTYIKNLLKADAQSQYVIIGKDMELEVTPENLKTGAVDIEHPNGRWIIHHDYTYFANNLGQSSQTESYTPDLLLSFDKPGAYNIYFDDTLVKTVYAHRSPVADFTMNISGSNLTLTSNSYDEDSNVNNGFGKGIAKETWSYKKADDTTWTQGKLTTIDKNVYIIKLEVEDMQGATSYTTKYTGVGNPVASFIVDKTSFSKYHDLKITNTSYDPVGYDISSYKWELKKDKSVVKTYTTKEPVIDFELLGAGTYSLSLTATNTQGTVSDSYTRTFTVLEDTTAPSITVDPTYSDWTDSQDINISIEDTGSGLKQWRYVYTQSQDKPAASAYGAWQTNTEESLHFDTDGEYYLHIQAVDNAGNEVIRTVGSYKITHPYTNKVTNNYGVSTKTDFVTFDWGKWYNPTTEFETKVNGFKLSDTFMANYPVAGTIYQKEDRLKQPSSAIEYTFSYEPVEYTATLDFGYDDLTEEKTYTVLDGFTLEKPIRENYEFIGWYLNGQLIKGVNDKVNNEFTSFEDFVSEMNLRTTGNIIIQARWNQSEFDEAVNVFAQIASEYKVTIPKTVVLSGQTKDASYYVKVEGDIAGYENIIVKPDETFMLNASNKAPVQATTSQDKTTWTVHDFDTDANGRIDASLITAGKWQGNVNFNITFNTPDEITNSEEYIEYQTVEYPQHAEDTK